MSCHSFPPQNGNRVGEAMINKLRIALLAAMTGLALASAPAQAVLVKVEIDDFNVGAQCIGTYSNSAQLSSVQSTFCPGATQTGSTASSALTGLNTADVIGGSRTLSYTLLAHDSLTQSSTRVDPVAATGGQLIINNGVGEQTDSRVSWTLPANLLPTTGTITDFAFHIALLSKDANALSAELLFNGASLGVFNLGSAAVTSLVDLYFSTPFTTINTGGVLQLKLVGGAGWDANIDDFGFQYQYTPPTVNVPVPATLALFGIGVAALYRRRR